MDIVVDLVRELRGNGVHNHRPTVRATITIARILANQHAHARLGDPVFHWVCRDVLNTDTAKVTRDGESLLPNRIEEAMAKVCAQLPVGFKKHVTNPGREKD